MINFLIHFIALFIRNKTKRRNFRKKWKAHFAQINTLKKLHVLGNYHVIAEFAKHKIKPKSVLVLEFNDFHGITLPGYINYFAELGYNVDCFLRFGQNVDWQPLCRLTCPYTAFVGNEHDLMQALNSAKIKKYDFVFVNTTFYYGELAPYPKGQSVFKLVGKVPAGKYGTLMIEHNYEPYVKKYHEEKYIKQGNLFTLLGFRKTKMLSSSYLGEVKITPKNTDVIKFLSIGTIHPSNKNYQILFDACENLLKDGVKNFEIQVIGCGSINDIPANIRPYFKLLGALTYKDMFDKIEQGDYLLNLFDPKNKEHHKYLDNWATGSSILFYAFVKLPLMHEFFAKSYLLGNDNAVVYKDLAKGMKQAIKMTPEEYLKRQKVLFDLTKDLQAKSLKNLTEQLERMKNVSSKK